MECKASGSLARRVRVGQKEGVGKRSRGERGGQRTAFDLAEIFRGCGSEEVACNHSPTSTGSKWRPLSIRDGIGRGAEGEGPTTYAPKQPALLRT